jgi:hypothetical protein
MHSGCLLFRTGTLEKSWRMITGGILCIALANIIFLCRNLPISGGFSNVLLYMGSGLGSLGGLFLLLGLRREYKLWGEFSREKPLPVSPPQKT